MTSPRRIAAIALLVVGVASTAVMATVLPRSLGAAGYALALGDAAVTVGIAFWLWLGEVAP